MKAMLKIAIISVLVWANCDAVIAQDKAPVSSAKMQAPKEITLPYLVNWADVAVAAQKARVPIIVMVSLEGCGFCKTVRQSHLLPLLALEKSTPRAILRQIEINGAQTVFDVDGKAVSHREFAQKLGAKVAPTVFFLNAEGKQIASPLEGGLLPDFYSAYLDDAIEVATKKMRPNVRWRSPILGCLQGIFVHRKFIKLGIQIARNYRLIVFKHL